MARICTVCVSDTNVQLSPLAAVLGPVFFAFSLAFAQELDARRIHQQMQTSVTACVRDLKIERLLAPRQCAEVWFWSIEP